MANLEKYILIRDYRGDLLPAQEMVNMKTMEQSRTLVALAIRIEGSPVQNPLKGL